MELAWIDWSIIGAFFLVSLGIGIAVAGKAGKNTAEFFLSGRNMPWWLLGISMVATTFAADTPNLVTDIIRQNGVSGNWVWWAFLLTGLLTVFVYAKLWRRSGILTDLAFYELRYSGSMAAFLRGFRAIYLGFFFNIVIMATSCLAAIKMGGVLLGLSPLETLLWASLVTVFYSSLGGLRGVLITDFFQFFIAMIGTIWAASYLVNLPEIGGLDSLLTHENVAPKLNLLPNFAELSFVELLPLFILPLAVNWWSVWYPGSEPGGGGYVAQRMLSAKDESHAMGATLLFNAAHYALRPWPWILIALCSIIVFPTLQDIQTAFPNIEENIIKEDLAYSAMLTYLPNGLLGIVVASLMAAFMSTLSTHLNWGSSYLVHDFYRRFIRPEGEEKHFVFVGRMSTVLIMVCSGIFALFLENAKQGFDILLQIGAGTGLLFILRWFWWRINAYSEITAMIVSFLLAVYFQISHIRLGFEPILSEWQLVIGIAITTLAWVGVTLLTRPTDMKVLISFYQLIRPEGPGWKPVQEEILSLAHEDGESVPKRSHNLSLELMGMIVGCLAIYSTLFATGFWIYGAFEQAVFSTGVAIISSYGLWKVWQTLQKRKAF